MSHFTVLVSLKEATEDALKKALQPFHEYECTGIKDQYVKRVVCDDYSESEFKKDTIPCLVKDTGEIYCTRYDREKSEKFWKREGIGISSKDKLILPSWLSEKDVPANDCYSSFIEYLKDWCGVDVDGDYYDYEDGVLYTYTNPNAQWDWWMVGGRWSDRLIDKNGNKGDQFHKKDIDFDAMKSLSVKSKLLSYEKAQDAFSGESFITWQDMMKDESITRDEQRAKYHAQPAIIRFKKVFDNPFVSAEEFNMDRESFIKKSEFEGVSTFAILHYGKWIEKGDMGWWGCVSDEKNPADWQETYEKALSEIPDSNYLVIVDCHI